MVDQRAAIAILLVMVMTLLILAVPRQARSGERVACEPQPSAAMARNGATGRKSAGGANNAGISADL